MTFQLLQRHKQECKTPDEVLNGLTKEFGMLFDPCPLEPEKDGLSISWGEKVYVNPPYNNIPNWLQKAHSEMSKGNSKLVIFLLPVDTSTRWFHDYILGQAEIRFIKGRLRFTENKPAPFASMIVIFKHGKIPTQGATPSFNKNLQVTPTASPKEATLPSVNSNIPRLRPNSLTHSQVRRNSQ